MKKALSLSLLAVVAVFYLACDNGQKVGIPDGVNTIVYMEREVAWKVNPSVRILATDFSLSSSYSGGYSLTFTCPCYLGPGGNLTNELASVLEVLENEVIKVRLLPGARYSIYERRLDSSQRNSYHLFR